MYHSFSVLKNDILFCAGYRTSKTIQQYNKIADKYAKNIENRIPIDGINKFVSFLKTTPKVVDIGCAAGRDSKTLYDKGVDITGIDLSEKLLAIAKKKYPYVQFQKADIRKLPFPDNTFDGIWAHAVFHHLDIEDMLPTLKEWNRVLKSKGVIYLSTKMGKGNWQGKDELSAGEQRKFTLLTQKELHQMLTKAEFTKIELKVKKDLTRNLYWLRGFYKKI